MLRRPQAGGGSTAVVSAENPARLGAAATTARGAGARLGQRPPQGVGRAATSPVRGGRWAQRPPGSACFCHPGRPWERGGPRPESASRGNPLPPGGGRPARVCARARLPQPRPPRVLRPPPRRAPTNPPVTGARGLRAQQPRPAPSLCAAARPPGQPGAVVREPEDTCQARHASQALI